MIRFTLPLLLLSSCVIGSDQYQRPRDLDASWSVDRLRILAVVADPPEAAPGQIVSFTALVTDPDEVSDGEIWVACGPDEATPFGCAVDIGGDLEDITPEELASMGVIGATPLWQPTYIGPEELLEGLDAQGRDDGVYVTIQATAFPANAAEAENFDDVNFNEVELATKRLIISESSQPNTNPVFEGFYVERIAVGAGTITEVDPGEIYALGAPLRAESVEEYVWTDDEGNTETRVEEPWVAWYTTRGEMLEPITLYPFLEADWRAPETSGAEGTWWAVARDRRGGMVWLERSFRVR